MKKYFIPLIALVLILFFQNCEKMKVVEKVTGGQDSSSTPLKCTDSITGVSYLDGEVNPRLTTYSTDVAPFGDSCVAYEIKTVCDGNSGEFGKFISPSGQYLPMAGVFGSCHVESVVCPAIPSGYGYDDSQLTHDIGIELWGFETPVGVAMSCAEQWEKVTCVGSGVWALNADPSQVQYIYKKCLDTPRFQASSIKVLEGQNPLSLIDGGLNKFSSEIEQLGHSLTFQWKFSSNEFMEENGSLIETLFSSDLKLNITVSESLFPNQVETCSLSNSLSRCYCLPVLDANGKELFSCSYRSQAITNSNKITMTIKNSANLIGEKLEFNIQPPASAKAVVTIVNLSASALSLEKVISGNMIKFNISPTYTGQTCGISILGVNDIDPNYISPTFKYSVVANGTYYLKCKDANGVIWSSAYIPISVVPAPILSLTMAPSKIIVGQKSILSWSAQNVLNCDSVKNNEGAAFLNSPSEVYPTKNSIYELKCLALDGLNTFSKTFALETSLLNSKCQSNSLCIFPNMPIYQQSSTTLLSYINQQLAIKNGAPQGTIYVTKDPGWCGMTSAAMLVEGFYEERKLNTMAYNPSSYVVLNSGSPEAVQYQTGQNVNTNFVSGGTDATNQYYGILDILKGKTNLVGLALNPLEIGSSLTYSVNLETIPYSIYASKALYSMSVSNTLSSIPHFIIFAGMDGNYVKAYDPWGRILNVNIIPTINSISYVSGSGSGPYYRSFIEAYSGQPTFATSSAQFVDLKTSN